jgi:hypothetical protein
MYRNPSCTAYYVVYYIEHIGELRRVLLPAYRVVRVTQRQSPFLLRALLMLCTCQAWPLLRLLLVISHVLISIIIARCYFCTALNGKLDLLPRPLLWDRCTLVFLGIEVAQQRD